jgi:hypothetical protein
VLAAGICLSSPNGCPPTRWRSRFRTLTCKLATFHRLKSLRHWCGMFVRLPATGPSVTHNGHTRRVSTRLVLSGDRPPGRVSCGHWSRGHLSSEPRPASAPRPLVNQWMIRTQQQTGPRAHCHTAHRTLTSLPEIEMNYGNDVTDRLSVRTACCNPDVGGNCDRRRKARTERRMSN